VTRRRIGPWLAVIVGGLIAALSIVAAVLLERSVSNQNTAELQSQAGQVKALAQTVIGGISPQLQPLDALARATNNSPSEFATEVQALYKGQMVPPTVAVVENGRVLLATGLLTQPAFPGHIAAGQPLPPALAAAVAGTHHGLFSPGVVRLGGLRVLVIAYGADGAGRAVLEVSPVASKPTPGLLRGRPGFDNLNIAFYAKPVADQSQLILTTAPTPLAGPVVKSTVNVGPIKWLVVTSATMPLAGTWPNAFPWIFLAAGLTLAIVLGVLVNVIGRRERYAQALVAERTAELESAQEEIVHRERLSAVGEMATMIGHELRNPLGAAINGLYLARHGLGDQATPQVTKGLDLAERETQRAASLADDLTAYMRERRPNLQRIPLGSAVDQVLEATPPPEGIDVRVDSRDVPIDADAAQLTQMLSNLVTNAYQAMPEGGSVQVGAAASDGHVDIVVEDTGPGLDAKAETRAFDPFFTTKAQGTGLGLAIVQRMAEAHGGSVTLENRESGGARVVIRLPRAEATAGGTT
jgi:signal transduction histidine kinase